VPEADNAVALVAWSRCGAAAALNQMQRHDQAIQLAEPVSRYEQTLINGVGAERLRRPTLYAALELARAYLGQGNLEQGQMYAQMLPRKRLGVGPSQGPFPELEDEGARLQEQIAQARQRGR